MRNDCCVTIGSASGDALVQEAMAAISILHKLAPELKIRFVNVSELTALGVGDERHPLSIREEDFCCYFTNDKPVIFNFHGYPGTVKKLIYGHEIASRLTIHGYMEEGTTTTPFNMMVMNKTDRYHLAMEAVAQGAKFNKKIAKKSKKIIAYLRKKLIAHTKYILKYGKDMP